MSRLIVFLNLGLALVSLVLVSPAQAGTVSVFATGLDNPRGLAFGPDGFLYVAEAGLGGTATTVDVCPELQVPASGGGPVMNGMTARISRVSRAGIRSTVVDGLPSSVTQFGGDQIGVSSVTFVKGTLYAVIAGGGCGNGVADPAFPNGVIRVARDGTWAYVANLSAYYLRHPTANPEPQDFTPDGVPYDAVAEGGGLYVLEANHGELDRVSLTNGRISRVVDISASQGHIVPTALSYRAGHFYVGNLGRFPIEPGTSSLLRIAHSGKLERVLSGLTAVLGLAFRGDDLYVLETSTVGPFPAAFSGRIVRIGDDGEFETIADGLNFPTAMTFGRDGGLYVSSHGYNAAPGEGEILRITVPEEQKGGGS